MEAQQPSPSPKARFPTLILICVLLSAPVWGWIAIRQGADRKLALWSVLVVEIIMIVAVCLGWRLALRRNRQ
jgi:hypothetical protein